MRGLPWRKALLLAGGLIAVLLLVGIPTLGQDVLDPQGELTEAECYGHHKQEGFRSLDIFPTVVTEVPKGQSFPFELTVKNPWLHDLKDVSAYVNISNAPGLEFPGAQPPVEKSEKGQQAPGTGGSYKTVDYPIPVVAGATEVYFAVQGAPTESPVPKTPGLVMNQSDFRVQILGMDGKPVSDGSAPPASYSPQARDHQLHAEAHVNTSTLLTIAPTTLTARVAYGDISGTSYDYYQAAYYNASQNTELLLKGPAILKPNEQFTFKFSVIAKSVEALQHMRYGGRGDAYHQHTDKNIDSDGIYDKYSTMDFRTGAKLTVGQSDVGTAGTSVSLIEPILRRWGQVLGFASSFLIIPSLVFGGTFGRGSVTAMNKYFGGPRRRVLFHNSMSFWLLGVAALHMFIYFYEAFWVWSAGLVWGGLALAAMVGLGVTGAVQRRFVAQWGFNRWRYVHFAMGILVVVFTLVHMVADGSHFAPVRALFGDVVQK